MVKLLFFAVMALLCASAHATSASAAATIPQFQIDFNQIVANMVAVETQVDPSMIPLLKIFESTLGNASAALAGYTNQGAEAVAESDFWTEMALNELVALQALKIPQASGLKAQLCSLAANIHTYVESQGASLKPQTPESCFSTLTVAQVWQLLLNDINARVVDLESVVEPATLAALQNITTAIEEISGGATLFPADAKAGVAAIANATDAAHSQIVALQASGALPAAKSTVLDFVDGAIGAVLNMAQLFEAATGGAGLLSITEASSVAAPVHAPAHAPAPAHRRMLM